MFIAYILLIALLFSTPVLVFADDPFAAAVIEAFVALAAAIVALEIRPGEAQHLGRILRRKWPFALIPAVVLVLQLSPWPATGVSKSIWDTAAQALGRSVWPSITIDPGATVLALGRYLSFLAVFTVATAVAIDRVHAERLMLALVGVCAAIALIVIGHDAFGFAFLGDVTTVGPRAAIAAASVLGSVLAAGAVVLVVERYETRHQRGQVSRTWSLVLLGAILAALIACWLAIVLTDSSPALFAAGCGLATVAVIVIVRRLGLGPWGAIVLAATAAFAAVAIAVSKAAPLNADLALRYAARAPAQLVSMAERMIADVGWTGVGGGAFHALAPIYRNVDPSGPINAAPTFMAQLAIETGRLSLWGGVVLLAVVVALLVRGALNRGRDSFYATAAAAAGVAVLIEAFGDGGLANLGVSILVAATFGLGLAQSVSRTE